MLNYDPNFAKSIKTMNRNKLENFISMCVQCYIQGNAELILKFYPLFHSFFCWSLILFLSNSGILLDLEKFKFWPSTCKLLQILTILGFFEAY